MRRHGWSDLGLGGTGRSDGERSYGGGGVSEGSERFRCAMTFM